MRAVGRTMVPVSLKQHGWGSHVPNVGVAIVVVKAAAMLDGQVSKERRGVDFDVAAVVVHATALSTLVL